MKPMDYVKDILIFVFGIVLIFTLASLSNTKEKAEKAAANYETALESLDMALTDLENQEAKAEKVEYEYQIKIVDLNSTVEQQTQVIKVLTEKVIYYQMNYDPTFTEGGE